MLFSNRHPLLCLTAVIWCQWEFPMTKSLHAVTLDRLGAGLPKQVSVWSAETDDRIYDSETIFGYIDGGAEVYRAYK